MTKKEPLLIPALGMNVFHETIYGGNECMKIVGIRADQVELEGDYSGGTHNVIQSDWLPIKGLFRLRKVCEQVEKYGSCQLHNLHCGYPNCEPYLTSDHHYENGVKIEH
ncbi:MAG: hypothetical protein WC810_14640 [Janthinobacterium sp.]|jgi:hypothetical protein